MPNKITPANLSNSSFLTPDSRYSDSKIYYYGDKNKITFETYKRKDTVFSENDLFFVIESGQEYRPDLVSRQAYGTTKYWWKIMEANQIFDIFDFKAGKTLRIPSRL